MLAEGFKAFYTKNNSEFIHQNPTLVLDDFLGIDERMKLQTLKTITASSGLWLIASQTLAIDSLPGVNLWLPKSYQEHYVKLIEAAKKIQREPECWKLLDGRLLESQSSPEAPVFYFRCRDADRKSFSYEVDMKTMGVFNHHLERQRLLAEKEAKKQALLAAQLMEENKYKETSYWKLCREAIEQKISSFNEAKITSEEQRQIETVDEDTMQFTVNVDSLSLTNKALRYTASCRITDPESIDVEIKRRKN